MTARFEPIQSDQGCRHCAGGIDPLIALGIDAVYCISLVEQPRHTALAARHFHTIGLCRVVFYRPNRESNTNVAIWRSHRAVAKEALSHRYKRILVLEDDARFSRPIAAFAPRVVRAQESLPKQWWALYLGHLPFQAYFTGPGVMRARSTCLHAYIANAPLLDWLASTPPLSMDAPMWNRIGLSIDAATANLPQMYAIFPMVARQAHLGTSLMQSRGGPVGRTWTKELWRTLLIHYGARAAELVAVGLSPFHRATLDRFRKRMARWQTDALFLRASGLFDARFYLDTNPDVASAEWDPLMHYMLYGAAEGRRPNAWFDPTHYASQARLRRGVNPLLHYLRAGKH